jgi:uncharacterized protein YjbJ (UPF0337 family)
MQWSVTFPTHYKEQTMANNFVNDDIVKGKWKQIKGEIQKAWGKLTDDELDQAQGDSTKLGGIVQQKYGLKQEEFRTKFNDIVSKFGPKADQ